MLWLLVRMDKKAIYKLKMLSALVALCCVLTNICLESLIKFVFTQLSIMHHVLLQTNLSTTLSFLHRCAEETWIYNLQRAFSSSCCLIDPCVSTALHSVIVNVPYTQDLPPHFMHPATLKEYKTTQGLHVTCETITLI